MRGVRIHATLGEQIRSQHNTEVRWLLSSYILRPVDPANKTPHPDEHHVNREPGTDDDKGGQHTLTFRPDQKSGYANGTSYQRVFVI